MTCRPLNRTHTHGHRAGPAHGDRSATSAWLRFGAVGTSLHSLVAANVHKPNRNGIPRRPTCRARARRRKRIPLRDAPAGTVAAE